MSISADQSPLFLLTFSLGITVCRLKLKVKKSNFLFFPFLSYAGVIFDKNGVHYIYIYIYIFGDFRLKVWN